MCGFTPPLWQKRVSVCGFACLRGRSKLRCAAFSPYVAEVHPAVRLFPLLRQKCAAVYGFERLIEAVFAGEFNLICGICALNRHYARTRSFDVQRIHSHTYGLHTLEHASAGNARKPAHRGGLLPELVENPHIEAIFCQGNGVVCTPKRTSAAGAPSAARAQTQKPHLRISNPSLGLRHGSAVPIYRLAD